MWNCSRAPVSCRFRVVVYCGSAVLSRSLLPPPFAGVSAVTSRVTLGEISCLPHTAFRIPCNHGLCAQSSPQLGHEPLAEAVARQSVLYGCHPDPALYAPIDTTRDALHSYPLTGQSF